MSSSFQLKNGNTYSIVKRGVKYKVILTKPNGVEVEIASFRTQLDAEKHLDTVKAAHDK